MAGCDIIGCLLDVATSKRPATPLNDVLRQFRHAGPLWILAIFIAAGIGLAVVGLRLVWIEYQLRSAAIPGQGAVVEKGETHKRSGNIYWVRYEFRPSIGRMIFGSGRLSREVWSGLGRGSSLTVYYLAGNPRQNRISFSFDDWLMPAICSGLGLFLCALMVFAFVIMLKDSAEKADRRRARRKTS